MFQDAANRLILILQFSSMVLSTAVLLPFGAACFADEKEKGIAVAPAGTDVFETSFEGTWFVDRELKMSYDALIAEVQLLEQRVSNGDITATQARDSIAALRESLAGVREKIDKQKTLVSAFEIVRQEVEGRIDLGPEKLLVVTADRIKVVGWSESYAKYVVVKTVLSTGTPVDEHLAGIRVIHEHKVSPELVGKTDAEMKVWRDDFLNPKEGVIQTPEQMENKKQMWERHFANGERFMPFVGREVDSLRIEGLIYQEGNQHLSYELKRPEGGGQFGSRWRRSADLTLYVPKCTALLLRGCQMGMDISGVNGHLMMTSAGSQDRDYNGSFSIRDHVGPITLSNVPMDVIERVTGDVRIEATTEMTNTGSHHADGRWVLFTPPPHRLQVSQVTGNLTANLTRSKLHIDGVDGILNVRNDFGDTHCTIAKSLIAGNHRIVGQSGLVSVLVAKDAKIGLPIFAATSCGSAATNLNRDELDDLNVTYNSTEGIRRDWRSLFTALSQNDFEARFALHERPDQIIADRERSPGLDLLSVAGRVEYIRMDK
ncbi:MAG: hypothetical protein JNL58_14565 [Planctomyces sp.]|nr:hypothetical protein [Planctomyces sp.]